MSEKKKQASTPKLNVKLLLDVKRHILAEPNRFDMDTWCEKSDEVSCGTAACLNGWGVILQAKHQGLIKRIFNVTETRFYSLMKRLRLTDSDASRFSFGDDEVTGGAKLYGVTENEAEMMFAMHLWPNKFHYDGDDPPLIRAKQGAAFIDWVIRRKTAGLPIVDERTGSGINKS